MVNHFAKPEKEIHLTGQLGLNNIRGHWNASMRDGVFVVLWHGHRNKCWAYLHQFDPLSRDVLINECHRSISYKEHDHAKNDWLR